MNGIEEATNPADTIGRRESLRREIELITAQIEQAPDIRTRMSLIERKMGVEADLRREQMIN